MAPSRDPGQLLDELEITEYEQTALRYLLELGRTTAPNLSDATGIPKARIYDVLSHLADAGYIKVIPGRPKEYEPKAPGEILDRAIENQRQSYESYQADIEAVRREFEATFGPMYEQADDELTPTEELFHVVDVGEPSESETRTLYQEASESLLVLTKSFEYFDSVAPAFESAYERDVDIRILCVHPDHLTAENRTVQEEIIAAIESEYPDIGLRYSNEPLPWRGTIIDPSMDYDTGKAIFLVEEKDIPLHMRQAAVTENGSFVAGMGRYFDLIWESDSVPDPG
ncbi:MULTISPECIES: TrmB family transcriptional regulator [Salinibaculum]|uniref:TrmB family transcriptional regulator n=1 Tax=Salinibaculum TaxID=2732368 RepID=UPI0030CEB8E9